VNSIQNAVNFVVKEVV